MRLIKSLRLKQSMRFSVRVMTKPRRDLSRVIGVIQNAIEWVMGADIAGQNGHFAGPNPPWSGCFFPIAYKPIWDPLFPIARPTRNCESNLLQPGRPAHCLQCDDEIAFWIFRDNNGAILNRLGGFGCIRGREKIFPFVSNTISGLFLMDFSRLDSYFEGWKFSETSRLKIKVSNSI